MGVPLIIRLTLPQALLIGYALIGIVLWAVLLVLGVRSKLEGAGR